MSPVDTFADRVRTALLGGAFGILVTALGSVLNAIGTPETASTGTEISFTLFIALFQSAPGLLTVAGILIAGYVAGPPGFFGAIIEVVRVNRVFDLSGGSSGGIELVIAGAIIVAISSLAPWPQIYQEVLSSGDF